MLMRGLRLLGGAAVLALLVGCGGGGGCPAVLGAAFCKPETSPVAAPVLSLTGMANNGAPLSGAAVTAQCVGAAAQTTTNQQGGFALGVVQGRLPCVLQLRSTAGEVLHAAIAQGSEINITPLTELVVAQAMGLTPSVAFDRLQLMAGQSVEVARITPVSLSAATQGVAVLLGLLPEVGIEKNVDYLGGRFVQPDGGFAQTYQQVLLNLQQALTRAGQTLTGIRQILAEGRSDAAKVDAFRVTMGLPLNFLASCPAARSGDYWLIDAQGEGLYSSATDRLYHSTLSFETAKMTLRYASGTGPAAVDAVHVADIFPKLDERNANLPCVFYAVNQQGHYVEYKFSSNGMGMFYNPTAGVVGLVVPRSEVAGVAALAPAYSWLGFMRVNPLQALDFSGTAGKLEFNAARQGGVLRTCLVNGVNVSCPDNQAGAFALRQRADVGLELTVPDGGRWVGVQVANGTQRLLFLTARERSTLRARGLVVALSSDDCRAPVTDASRMSYIYKSIYQGASSNVTGKLYFSSQSFFDLDAPVLVSGLVGAGDYYTGSGLVGTADVQANPISPEDNGRVRLNGFGGCTFVHGNLLVAGTEIFPRLGFVLSPDLTVSVSTDYSPAVGASLWLADKVPAN